METPVYDKYTMGEHNWAPGTMIRLAAVPWDATYRDIVDFKDRGEVGDFLANKSYHIRFDKAQTILPGFPVKVDIPYDQALKYNYLQAWNPAYSGTEWPGGSNADGHNSVIEQHTYDRSYFYFIQDIEYCSPNATKLYLQVDVWTTYCVGSNLQFGRCMVERGHALMCNRNEFLNNGSQFLSEPEDLDVGGELVTAKMWAHSLLRADSEEARVIVWASTRIDGDLGNVDNPKLQSADGCQLEGVPNALACYLFDSIADFRHAIDGLRDTPWGTSGIQSCQLINMRWLGQSTMGTFVQVGGQRAYKIDSSEALGRRMQFKMIDSREEWRPSFGGSDSAYRARYGWLKKFRVAPYCMLEMTTDTGTPILLKPELVPTTNGFWVVEYASCAMPSPRIAYLPWGYGRMNGNGEDMDWTDGDDVLILGGEGFDMATWLANLPQFSVLNDGYLNTIASQAHSLAYAAESAAWAQDKARAGAELAYNQATRGIETGLQNNQIQNRLSNQLTQRSNDAAWDSSFINAGMGGLGVIGNLASGNVGGAVTGIAGVAAGMAQTGVATSAASDKTAMSIAASQNIAGNNAAAARYNRDTNREYAQWAAKGDYENAIAGINAKKQDARLTQPTISGQQGGDNLMLSTTGLHLLLKLKQVNWNALRSIGDYWLRYGYAIRKYIHLGEELLGEGAPGYVRNGVLSLMTRYTYWKMGECKIGGDIPEQYKNTVRGIFEKGVTVWKDPDYIIPCDIYDNKPDKDVVF